MAYWHGNRSSTCDGAPPLAAVGPGSRHETQPAGSPGGRPPGNVGNHSSNPAERTPLVPKLELGNQGAGTDGLGECLLPKRVRISGQAVPIFQRRPPRSAVDGVARESTRHEMIDRFDVTSELDQLRSRGEEAVAELLDRYRPKLLRMIVLRLDGRILGKVDCEDILQDAFVEAARRIQDYLNRPSVPFFVWLRQITSQVLIDTHRRYLGAKMRDVNLEVTLHRAGSAGRSE